MHRQGAHRSIEEGEEKGIYLCEGRSLIFGGEAAQQVKCNGRFAEEFCQVRTRLDPKQLRGQTDMDEMAGWEYRVQSPTPA